jgi:NADPH:quinone reductase-like Zn-dependent oxidoreductase
MPGLGEVRIAVRAAGVNPVDWKRYSGTMGADARLPLRLGFEVAGGRGGRRRGGWPGRACRCG